MNKFVMIFVYELLLLWYISMDKTARKKNEAVREGEKMPRPDVLGTIQDSSLMVVVNGVDAKVIEELLETGIKIFERRLDGKIFHTLAEKEMNELRSIVGEDALVGAIGLRDRDQIEACSGSCDFFTPGSNGIRDEVLRGMAKIGYCFGAEDVYRDNEVKPMRLYRYPGHDYVQYLSDLLDSFGHNHKLIATPHNIWEGVAEIAYLFQAGAHAIEVKAKDVSMRTDYAISTSVAEIVSRMFEMIELSKSEYQEKQASKEE